MHGPRLRAKISVLMAEIPEYLKQAWPTTRQSARRALESRLVVTSAQRRPYRGWCQNVGEGGLGATVAAPLKLGDTVALEFELAGNGEPISVRAAVRFTDGFRHGFEFLELTPAQRAAIQAYLSAPQVKGTVGGKREKIEAQRKTT